MGLTEFGLIVLGVGVLLIVIAFFAQLVTGTATTSSDHELAAPQGGANPIAAIIAAVADALKALGELLTAVLGMFNPLCIDQGSSWSSWEGFWRSPERSSSAANG